MIPELTSPWSDGTQQADSVPQALQVLGDHLPSVVLGLDQVDVHGRFSDVPSRREAA